MKRSGNRLTAARAFQFLLSVVSASPISPAASLIDVNCD
jgi:hypothetical protein